MELHLHYIFAFVCGTMLAASVGATGDSRLKRSEASPSEGVKICLLSCRMTPAGCNDLCKKRCNEECDRRFPHNYRRGMYINIYFYYNLHQYENQRRCKASCWKEIWSQPSEGVKICLLKCRMTPAGCNDLCEKRCNEECDRRFPHKDVGARRNLRLCKGSCKTEIRRFVEGKGV